MLYQLSYSRLYFSFSPGSAGWRTANRDIPVTIIPATCDPPDGGLAVEI
jgi:hypothetical protein